MVFSQIREIRIARIRGADPLHNIQYKKEDMRKRRYINKKKRGKTSKGRKKIREAEAAIEKAGAVVVEPEKDKEESKGPVKEPNKGPITKDNAIITQYTE